MFGYSGKLLSSSPQKRDTFSTLCWTLLERQVMFLNVREPGAATNVLRMSTKKKSLPRMQNISRKRPNFGSGLCIIFQ